MQESLPAGCEIIALPIHADERGQLVSIEERRDAPFDIARVYYVMGVRAGVRRGRHAHRTLTQLAVAISGSCRMHLDDGRAQATVELDDPARGLLLPSMVWHEMSDFSADCVLLVAASAPYDEGDYIRDYRDFLAAAESTQA